MKINGKVEKLVIGGHEMSIRLPLDYAKPSTAKKSIEVKRTLTSDGFKQVDRFVKSFNVCFGI